MGLPAVRLKIQDEVNTDLISTAKTVSKVELTIPVCEPISASERETLILDHYDLGHRLARSFLHRWRIRLTAGEISSAVGTALVEAAQRFEPTKGASFRTFFFYHLRGLLIKDISKIIAEKRTLRIADEEEVMSGSSPENEVHYLWPQALIEVNTPEVELQKKESRDICTDAYQGLDWLEREVVIRCFVDDQQVTEIAKELGYCRCHISRVKSRALKKMKKQLKVQITPNGEEKLLTVNRQYSGGRGRRQKVATKKQKTLGSESKLRSVG